MDLGIKGWYNRLDERDKLKVVEHFCVLMAKKGMILVSGKGTLFPDHELPHEGTENSNRRRTRERKEKKIGDKCQSKAVAEMYVKYLKGEF